jgi:hypothetical protein
MSQTAWGDSIINITVTLMLLISQQLGGTQSNDTEQAILAVLRHSILNMHDFIRPSLETNPGIVIYFPRDVRTGAERVSPEVAERIAGRLDGVHLVTIRDDVVECDDGLPDWAIREYFPRCALVDTGVALGVGTFKVDKATARVSIYYHYAHLGGLGRYGWDLQFKRADNKWVFDRVLMEFSG